MPRLPPDGKIRPVRSWIEATLRRVGERTEIPFAVRHTDGAEYRTRDAAPAFTLVFRKPRAYWRIAAFGHVGLLEAYFDGDLDIEGSLAKALAAGMEGGIDQARRASTGVRNRWHELTHSNAERVAGAAATPSSTTRCSPEFYKLLARRSAHALHLRVLEGRHAHAGRGAAQQVRPRGAEAAAQAGRGGGRRRQRLRRLHVPRAGALRASRSPRSTPPARRPSTRAARSSAGAWAASLQMHGDFRDARRASSTRWPRSAASSTPGATSSPS